MVAVKLLTVLTAGMVLLNSVNWGRKKEKADAARSRSARKLGLSGSHRLAAHTTPALLRLEEEKINTMTNRAIFRY